MTHEIRSGPIRPIPDLAEVRHRLILENREIEKIQEVTTARVSDDGRYESSLVLANRVETALYWFFSAPALFYLIYLIVRPLIGIQP
jgi:hypothetical protein